MSSRTMLDCNVLGAISCRDITSTCRRTQIMQVNTLSGRGRTDPHELDRLRVGSCIRGCGITRRVKCARTAACTAV